MAGLVILECKNILQKEFVHFQSVVRDETTFWTVSLPHPLFFMVGKLIRVC